MIETPAEILSHAASPDAASSFVAWRKKLRKPLTERAALSLAKTLAAINAAGGDATEALDLAQEFGWRSIKPEWYWAKKRQGKPLQSSVDHVEFASMAVRRTDGDPF